ncbi:MAG: hypothetical protein D8M58_19860 [Calditrichaeota bacterium]|nr:MAG: hypothetical protein DWQ03_14605 [Calditrichota bacterium]MBL1207666.1 hypothetical protein [Calditrichota bacterium]NOG47499.1 SpoIIE family protein phosphatase [Calditrichota bacterium]
MNLDALKKPKIYITLLLWIVAVVLLLQKDQVIAVFTQVAVIYVISSWFFLNRFLMNEVKISNEIVFFSFVITHYLNLQLISFYDQEILSATVPLFIEVLHQFLVALQILLFALVVTINNKKKQRIIFIYILLAILAHFVIYQELTVVRILFDFLLFFVLLKRTVWLDDLHKKTLGIYFIFFAGLFFMLLSKNPFSAEWNVLSSNASWFTIPFFLYDLIKIYTLAVIVKIPAVIIYNHMTLSRKLWFAGIFQSLIPQIFQLTLSLILFFFFVSAWQAQNLQEDLNKSGFISTGNTQPKIISDEDAAKLKLSGIIKKTYPEESYYYFVKDSASSKIIYYQNIDSLFCQDLWSSSQTIFGNGLLAYPVKLRSWERYLNKADFWQRGKADKISPFSFIDAADGWFTGHYEVVDKTKDFDAVLFAMPTRGLSFGRVTLPLYNPQGQQISHFAFDIMFNYKRLVFSDPMVGILFAIALIFFLINSFIIRRVSEAGAIINKTIISKFENLKVGIREIAGGNLKHKLKLVGEDEFVELAHHFNKMGEKLEETIAEAREKDRLDQELSVARDVQLSLLKNILPDLEGFEIVATLETAQEVSGDFYDVVYSDENKALFTIGDVSGKGASAAFYMAQYISLFRFSAQFTAFPKEIALRINEYFTKHVDDRHIFITAIIGVVDLKSGRITFVRAGHNNPYYLNAGGEVNELNMKGIGIGLTKDSTIFKNSLEKHELVLNENDKLVLYTDGLIEATRVINNAEEQYGEEKLIQKLSTYKNKNASFIINDLTSDVEKFFSGQPKNDDLTLLVIQKV